MAGEDDAQIRAIVTGLERVTERVVVRLSFHITANLVEDTPVDLGWARANWVPYVGTNRTTPVTSKPTPGGVAAQAAAQASAQAAVLGYRLASGAVFISNNVPYIGRLNDGSSTQAPRGFVQAGIRRGVEQTARDLAGGTP